MIVSPGKISGFSWAPRWSGRGLQGNLLRMVGVVAMDDRNGLAGGCGKAAGNGQHVEQAALAERRINAGLAHLTGDGGPLRGVFGDEDRHVRLEQEVAAAELVLNDARRLVGIDAAQLDAPDHGKIGEAVLSHADVGGELRGIEDFDVEQIAGTDVDGWRVGHRGTMRCAAELGLRRVRRLPGLPWAWPAPQRTTGRA